MIKISAKDTSFLGKLIDKLENVTTSRGPAPGEQSFIGRAADSVSGLFRPGRKETSGIIGTLSGLQSRNSLLSAALNTAGILGLGGMAASAASQIYNAVEDKVKSHNAYHDMFEEFPELKDADRKQVDKYWTVLRDYSPELTRNPLVAGQFVSNMMQYGMRGIDHNTIGQLASIHNDLNKDRSDAIKNLNAFGSNLVKEDYKGLITEMQG